MDGLEAVPMAANFEGIFVATVTPFTAKGELDEQALGKLVDFELKAGVNGIYACGTTGEGVSMTTQQRKRVAEICLEHAKGKATVMTQVGDQDIDKVKELARHARDNGLDGIACLTPYYYKPDEKGILDYYREVSSFTDLPLFIYHIPPMTGLTLSSALIARIMEEIPNIRGIKDSSGDFKHLLEIIYLSPKGQAIFSGSDEYALAGFISGMSGCVSGYSSAFPDLYVTLYKHFRDDEIRKAIEVQKKISMIKSKLRSPYIQPIKEALKMRGVNGGYVRKPLRHMSKKEISDLEQSLRELKAI
ncbi:MAG: dihydrodipicolinate synthase family protein [Methanomassiliicoccales archaeon]